MKLLVLPLLAGLLIPLASHAEYKYDPSTGNSYNYYTNPYTGQTTVRGYNGTTGSQWNTTIQPDGNMRGQDADGNFWNYNDSTGSYYNYGSGKICTGKGAYRVCN